MNAPAHVAASLLIWRNEPGWGAATAVTVGALLPDAPMFAFYGYQKFIAGRSESDIWSTLYFDDRWQLFFDIFNSIPLMLLVIGVCYLFGFRLGVLLGASVLLHLCCTFAATSLYITTTHTVISCRLPTGDSPAPFRTGILSTTAASSSGWRWLSRSARAASRSGKSSNSRCESSQPVRSPCISRGSCLRS